MTTEEKNEIEKGIEFLYELEGDYESYASSFNKEIRGIKKISGGRELLRKVGSLLYTPIDNNEALNHFRNVEFSFDSKLEPRTVIVSDDINVYTMRFTKDGVRLDDLQKVNEDSGLEGTQKKIADVTTAVKKLLLYKNEKYGDSALNGVKVFSAIKPESSICIRLDDKLARVRNGEKGSFKKNDLCDLIGYLTLLCIEEGVTAEDIEKMKD